MSQVYPPDKYHDGRSPSAWTVSIGGMIAAVVIAIGAVTGPSWVTIWIGVAVFVVAAIAAVVLSRRGLSNRA